MPTLTERLTPWIEDYQLQLPRWTHNELYKWRAVKVFQDNWNLQATDFPAMLKKSFAGAGNLLNNARYLAGLMTQRFAEQMPEEVRAAFSRLYDESQPLEERLTEFKAAAKDWLQRLEGKPANNAYQDDRALLVYLTLRYPDRYYLFKAMMYQDFAQLVGAPVDKRQKAGMERVREYLALANEVREVLASVPELVAAHQALLTPDCYPDPELHLLTQNFIYCTVKAKEELAGLTPKDDDDEVLEELPGVPDELPEVTFPAESAHPSARWWTIGAGEDGYLWEDWMKEGIISIGWDELGSLHSYQSKEEVRLGLVKKSGGQTSRKNDALACWQFYKDVRPGDYVVAKQGHYVVLGVGQVTGSYQYQPDRDEFQHVRRVKWELEGYWERTEDGRLTTKTLTEVTGHKLVKQLKSELETPLQLRPFGRNSVVGEDKVELEQVEEAGSPPYTFTQASADLFMSDAALTGLLNSLKRKKNLILQGPPGVGKSFVAKRLAYLLLGVADDTRVEMVQFHPSYSYEDFIMGYRASGTGFVREAGVFLKFVRDVVTMNPGKDYVFIIDEMNRANLGKVLGECMLLLESDKRGPEHKVMLPYGGEYMYLPNNLYLIGTMNTADRSLALVDFALRRRFAFKRLQPEIGERFAAYLIEKHGLAADFVAQLVDAVQRVNAKVAADRSLGADFLIGHSYFSGGPQQAESPAVWYERVLEDEIGPQLEEYWIENPSQAHEARKLLDLVPVLVGDADE